ncbi:MAG: FHA domain-containing protein [Pseudomonadales bacterium]|nr:FHA domain-containing protein [Pseudomonadales bacterium]
MSVKVIIIKDKPIAQLVVSRDITTIGRKSDCDISIKDPAISGNHAEIHKAGDGYIVKDLNSTNGIMVAGNKVMQHNLKHNDVVAIGEHQLKFLISPVKPRSKLAATVRKKLRSPVKSRQEVSKPATVANSVATRPGIQGATKPARKVKETGLKPRSPAVVAARVGETRAQAMANLDGFLQVISGENSGEKIRLQVGLTTIGEPGVQIAAVSKKPQGHFIIHVDGGKDKHRVPLVNGEPTGFKSRKLESGDKIEVAGVEMEYILGS